MARLECEKKLAFFPTDTKTLGKFLDKISVNQTQENFLVCDSCCGEGVALSMFKRFEGVKTYGVELDDERAKIAFTRVDELIHGDGLLVSKSYRKFGMLFLNPPYGDIRNKQQKIVRLETEFVRKWGLSVATNGYLLLVINPSSANETMARILAEYEFSVECVFYDENAEYKKFNQFFILLKRDKAVCTPDEILQQIQLENAEDLNSFESIDIKIPSTSTAGLIFRAAFGLREWQKIELVKKSCKISSVREQFFNTRFLSASSIQIPNEGQSALLLGAGLCENAVNGFLIKGSVTKIETAGENATTIDSKGKVKTRVQENFCSQVYAFDTNRGKYMKLV